MMDPNNSDFLGDGMGLLMTIFGPLLGMGNFSQAPTNSQFQRLGDRRRQEALFRQALFTQDTRAMGMANMFADTFLSPDNPMRSHVFSQTGMAAFGALANLPGVSNLIGGSNITQGFGAAAALNNRMFNGNLMMGNTPEHLAQAAQFNQHLNQLRANEGSAFTQGFNRTEMGAAMAHLSTRGAFQGSTVGADGEFGAESENIRATMKMMRAVKDVFGDLPAGDLINIAEQVTGVVASSKLEISRMEQRLLNLRNMAEVTGADPRTIMETTAQLGSSLRQSGVGARASGEIAFSAVSQGRYAFLAEQSAIGAIQAGGQMFLPQRSEQEMIQRHADDLVGQMESRAGRDALRQIYADQMGVDVSKVGSHLSSEFFMDRLTGDNLDKAMGTLEDQTRTEQKQVIDMALNDMRYLSGTQRANISQKVQELGVAGALQHFNDIGDNDAALAVMELTDLRALDTFQGTAQLARADQLRKQQAENVLMDNFSDSRENFINDFMAGFLESGGAIDPQAMEKAIFEQLQDEGVLTGDLEDALAASGLGKTAISQIMKDADNMGSGMERRRFLERHGIVEFRDGDGNVRYTSTEEYQERASTLTERAKKRRILSGAFDYDEDRLRHGDNQDDPDAHFREHYQAWIDWSGDFDDDKVTSFIKEGGPGSRTLRNALRDRITEYEGEDNLTDYETKRLARLKGIVENSAENYLQLIFEELQNVIREWRSDK